MRIVTAVAGSSATRPTPSTVAARYCASPAAATAGYAVRKLSRFVDRRGRGAVVGHEEDRNRRSTLATSTGTASTAAATAAAAATGATLV